MISIEKRWNINDVFIYPELRLEFVLYNTSEIVSCRNLFVLQQLFAQYTNSWEEETERFGRNSKDEPDFSIIRKEKGIFLCLALKAQSNNSYTQKRTSMSNSIRHYHVQRARGYNMCPWSNCSRSHLLLVYPIFRESFCSSSSSSSSLALLLIPSSSPLSLLAVGYSYIAILVFSS